MTTAVEEVTRLFPARPRLLALGEPTHGEDALLRVRNEIFRHLVEHEGYRTIAIESDCLRGLVVDDYVRSGAGTLDEAMARGFSHEWGAFPGNRDLVRWMRAHNKARSADERVSFAGFDGPLEITAAASPRVALTALHAYLAAEVDADQLPCSAETLDRLLGEDDRWTDPAAMMNPAASVGRTPEARELRLLADDLAARLDMQPVRDDRARLWARTATGLLRYHFWMADPSPGRIAWLLGVRDLMMAGNLGALAERGPTLVSSHNGHLQRNRSSMLMGGRPVHWWSAGAVLSAALGEQYAFLATAVGTIRHHGVEEPSPTSVEGLLYALPHEHCVLSPRQLTALVGDKPLTPRVSPWFGYAPLDPAHLTGVDGIVFVKDSARATASASARTGRRSGTRTP